MHLLVMCKLQLEFGTSEKETSIKQVRVNVQAVWDEN